jgi:outer membrane murein-binding lipoprotein Lpp
VSFFNKAKQAAEQAAAKVQEGVEDVQQKRELSQAYGELGKATFELLESGEISNPRFDATAAKIRELKAKIAAPSASSAPNTATGVDPTQPN